jgi:hypothetical protein
MVVMADTNCGADGTVVAEIGAAIGVVRVQLRRLLLQTPGLGALPFRLRQARFSVPLGLTRSKLRLGTFTAGGRLPLLRGSLSRRGLSGEPFRFPTVSIGLHLPALIRLPPRSREEHQQSNDDQHKHHNDDHDDDWIHHNPLVVTTLRAVEGRTQPIGPDALTLVGGPWSMGPPDPTSPAPPDTGRLAERRRHHGGGPTALRIGDQGEQDPDPAARLQPSRSWLTYWVANDAFACGMALISDNTADLIHLSHSTSPGLAVPQLAQPSKLIRRQRLLSARRWASLRTRLSRRGRSTDPTDGHA